MPSAREKADTVYSLNVRDRSNTKGLMFANTSNISGTGGLNDFDRHPEDDIIKHRRESRNIVIWSDWYSKKHQFYKASYDEYEDFDLVRKEEVFFGSTRQEKHSGLECIDLIIVAAQSLAKRGKKLSLQQYEAFKALVQSFCKRIIGTDLPNYIDYLAKKYGFIRYSNVLAFVMGRRFGKTWTYTYTEACVLTTQPQWSSIIVNVGARVGSNVSLNMVKDFVEEIQQDGVINCKIIKKDKEWIKVASHKNGKNTLFSSPGIESNGGKVRISNIK
jgi:hypothetical protein